MLVYLFMVAGESVPPLLYAQNGSCYLHPNEVIWAMMYEPSDIAIDATRGLLLVVSVQQIVAHSMTDSSATARSLIEIPNTDLEGLTYAGDRLFALSEGLGTSALIELEWNGDTLQIAQRWPMNDTAQAEGIAYGADDKGEALFITQDERIEVIDLPSVETLEFQRRAVINSRILQSGLTYGRISSMYFFEGLLYVLYDNDRKCRGWDMETGTIQIEFNLPTVGGGNDKQWEGLAIERMTGESMLGNNAQFLRGATTEADLIVRLSLDSPPQVWSFAVKEDQVAGRLIFPDCAAIPDVIPVEPEIPARRPVNMRA
jgi:hypothetical protein